MRSLLAIPSQIQRELMEQALGTTRKLEIIGSVPDVAQLPELVRQLAPRVLLMDLESALLPGLEVATEVTTDSPGTIVVALLPPVSGHHVELLLRSGIACFVHSDAKVHDVIHAITRVAAGRCPHVDGSSWCRQSLQVLCDSRPLSAARESLTQREKEVLHLLIRGCTSHEMGARLFISARTVEDHVASLFRKLRLHDKRALACAKYGVEETGALAVLSWDSRTCECQLQQAEDSQGPPLGGH